jgi:hypothetical protein
LHQNTVMKYIEFLWAIDLLAKYYPKYYSTDLLILADDILKWLNDELPEDSSTLIYLKECFESPTEGLKAIWNDVLMLAGPLGDWN